MEPQQTTSSPEVNTVESIPQTNLTEQKPPTAGLSKKLIIILVLGVCVVGVSAYFVVVKTSLFATKTDVIDSNTISSSTEPIVMPVATTTASTDKFYEAYSGEYSFRYPAVVEDVSSFASLRDPGMETTLKKSPVYHLEPFGLQQTFSDSGVTFGVGTTSADGVHNVYNLLKADLAVHKIASSTVYLTSSLFGYDPADWGKIKQTISIQEYVKDIATKTNIPNRTVTVETVHGTQVRHIMPFTLARPYENETREQYQWVKDGYIFSLIVSNKLTATSTAVISGVLKQQLLNTLITTFEVKK